MRSLAITLVFTLFAVFAFGQEATLMGYTLDKGTNDTIPYATIGILKKGIGTVSNNSGKFEFDTSNALDTDTVQISSIGYKTINYTVASFRQQLAQDINIQLEEQVEMLDEIVISTKKEWKQKLLGSDSQSQQSMGFSSNLGSELSRKINIRKKPTRLLEFKTYVVENTYETIKLRLNIYKADGNMPGKRMNTQNIFVEYSGESGILAIDLEPYNIMVEEDIYVALEWVDNYGSGQFRISSPFGTSGIKHKWASADEWRTIPFTLAFNVLVEY